MENFVLTSGRYLLEVFEMTDSEGMIIYAAQYPNLDTAKADFEGIKALHHADFIGQYDAALFTKEEGGKVKIIDTDETARAHGATGGAIAGAVIGIIFPPSILGLAAGGGVIGAIIGHVHKGMPRKDIKEIGDTLDDGEAGIILVGEATIEEGLDKLLKQAAKVMKSQIQADADEMKRELDAATKS